MSEIPFDFPFPLNDDDPCKDDPCPSSIDCLVCGFEDNCPPGSGCSDLFGDIKFLNGYISGFNARLGFGGSESTVNVDLVFAKNICMPSPSLQDDSDPNDSPCVLEDCEDTDKYDGRLGYLYTFSLGGFCFRGILTNHTYSEGSDGFKYKLTLGDGRNLLNNTTVILNSIYDRPPVELEHSVLNALYFLEQSVDDCDGAEKCDDFMKSGANKKGIFLKRAIEKLDGKQIQVPISKICLKLNFSKLKEIIPSTYRTTTTESTILDLIVLCCEEAGYDFFCKINNDNEIEIVPVNYKKQVTDKPLLQFLDDLDATDDIVISREYGEEMTFEKNKRIIFGDNYHYLMTIDEPEPSVDSDCTLSPPNTSDCYVINSPLTKLVTRDTDDPIQAGDSPEPSCGLAPPPIG
jgi:hypothetical protein